MYGLAIKNIQQINAVFKDYTAIERAILYGSRATGKYRNNSDIDLTLIGQELTLNDLLEIENALEELLLPYKIDLSIYDKIENEELRSHIDRNGKIFYSS